MEKEGGAAGRTRARPVRGTTVMVAGSAVDEGRVGGGQRAGRTRQGLCAARSARKTEGAAGGGVARDRNGEGSGSRGKGAPLDQRGWNRCQGMTRRASVARTGCAFLGDANVCKMRELIWGTTAGLGLRSQQLSISKRVRPGCKGRGDFLVPGCGQSRRRGGSINRWYFPPLLKSE